MDQLNVVTLNQAKLWLRVDADDDSNDQIITTLIKAAVNQVEKYTLQILYQRALTARTTVNGAYKIYEYPLLSVESVGDETWNEYETQWYTEVIAQNVGLQTVTFVAGYGWDYNLGSEVPEDIITAIYEMLTYWYENRDNARQGMPDAATYLLAPYRRISLF
jgi:hypothetical protein